MEKFLVLVDMLFAKLRDISVWCVCLRNPENGKFKGFFTLSGEIFKATLSEWYS
jgi:hypothetical protein